MSINLTVTKLQHDDPRFPDKEEMKGFSDIYLCTVTMYDGSQLECGFLAKDWMTPYEMSAMLQNFAAAVAGIGRESKTAQ